MAFTLSARAGDAQAIKVCAAARVAGVDVAFSPVPSLAELRRAKGSPFGTNTLVLATPGGAVLTEPNACCILLGEPEQQLGRHLCNLHILPLARWRTTSAQRRHFKRIV